MSFSSVIDLNLPSGCSHGAKISFADSLDNSWHVAGSSGSNANEIVAHRIFHKHRGKLTNLPTITPVGHLFDFLKKNGEAIQAVNPNELRYSKWSFILRHPERSEGSSHVVEESREAA